MHQDVSPLRVPPIFILSKDAMSRIRLKNTTLDPKNETAVDMSLSRGWYSSFVGSISAWRFVVVSICLTVNRSQANVKTFIDDYLIENILDVDLPSVTCHLEGLFCWRKWHGRHRRLVMETGNSWRRNDLGGSCTLGRSPKKIRNENC